MPDQTQTAISTAILVLVASSALSQPDPVVPATRPVLVELFTSQGCSSCPPADAYVQTLLDRHDVLALTFHVDYWDDVAWVDPYSSPAYTLRQKRYARSAIIYTPQIVVDGGEETVGSDRDKVASAIRRAAVHPLTVPLSVARGPAGITISAGASTTEKNDDLPAKLYLLTFDPSVTTAIRAGENGGRTIRYTNVVRSIREIGSWNSAARQQVETLGAGEKGSRIAVIIQDRSDRIIGVASSE